MNVSPITKSAWLGGAGKIGLAIIRGVLLRSKLMAPENVVITARHPTSLERLGDLAVGFTIDNRTAVTDAQVIVVCVHPNEVADVLTEIRPKVSPHALIISVVTGIPTWTFEEALGESTPVIRCVPNTAVLVGESMSVLCTGRHTKPEHLQLAQAIFGCVGKVSVTDERHMNAVTGLAGCGPAFVFRIIEALAQGGIKCGLPRDVSRLLAAQVLKGAAQLVLETGRHPAELKDEVTSPGGCTIDGLTKLEERGLPIALIEAVETATHKAGKLCRKNGAALAPSPRPNPSQAAPAGIFPAPGDDHPSDD